MSSDRRLRAASLAVVPVFVAVLVAMLVATLVACGRQGDPRPRPRAVPQPAKDLAIRQRGAELLLEFSYPTATVAGLPLERLASATVYEAAVPTLAGGKVPTLRETELEAMAKPVVELAGPTLDEAVVGGKISTRRVLAPEMLGGAQPEAEAARVYAVRTKGQSGEVSPFSNTVGLKPRTPPPPPAELEVVAMPKGVSIRWHAPAGTTPLLPPPPPAPAAPAPAAAPAAGSSPAGATAPPAGVAPPPTPATPAATTPPSASAAPATAPATSAASPPATAAPASATPSAPIAAVAIPATAASPSPPATPGLLPIAGYVVLRREATNPRWGAPLATLSPTVLEHLDRTAPYGTRYVYTVLTLLQAEPPIESAPQSAIEIDYRDLFAPTPPTELRALLVGDAVRLVWEPSPEADLAGYWVERAESGAGFRRVNATLATGADYSDPLPPGGGGLRYRLLAVDRVGNVSAPTGPVAVDRP